MSLFEKQPGRPRRTLLYALGGGLGHVTRGLALVGQLKKSIGGEFCLLTNSPFAKTVLGELQRYAGLTLSTIPPTTSAEEVGWSFRSTVFQWRPELLIVDTFPRGLGGELAWLLLELRTMKKVLIGRTLPDEYVQSFDLTNFVQQHYDLIIVPGEASPWDDLPIARKVEPILIRHGDEHLSAHEAANRLRLPTGSSCVLVVGSGTFEELLETDAMVSQLAAAWPTSWPPLRWAIPAGLDVEQFPAMKQLPELVVRYFPVSELFSAVRVLIGSAGYNLVHEAEAAGIPLFAAVRNRLYDQQAIRAKATSRVKIFNSIADLRALLSTELAAPHQPASPNSKKESGAQQAARWIATL